MASVKKTPVKKEVPTIKKAPISSKVESTAAVKPVKVTSKGIKVDVFDLTGKVTTSIELPSELFGSNVNKQIMIQAVRVYLANQRQGTQSTKTRGEVRGSTRKIYRQKGTGRARHGGITAPIFVGGGIALGPKPRDHSMSFPKKMRKVALASALTSQLIAGKVKVIDGLEGIEPKTKVFVATLKNLDLDVEKKKVLVVLPAKTDNVSRSVRNVEGVSFVIANQLNTYDVLNTKTLLVMKSAVETLEKTFGRGAK